MNGQRSTCHAIVLCSIQYGCKDYLAGTFDSQKQWDFENNS